MDLQQLTDEVEAVSDIYARKHGIDRDDTWFLLKLQEEVGELTQIFLMRVGQARNKGHSAEQLESEFRSELADVFCQVGPTSWDRPKSRGRAEMALMKPPLVWSAHARSSDLDRGSLIARDQLPAMPSPGPRASGPKTTRSECG